MSEASHAAQRDYAYMYPSESKAIELEETKDIPKPGHKGTK